jgi:hypothetical protein
VNLCRSCGQDFGSVELFDRHRVGTHAYTYTQGVAMTPVREDGRRCLSIAEMGFLGWQRGARGRWIDPARAARALEAKPQAARGIPKAA